MRALPALRILPMIFVLYMGSEKAAIFSSPSFNPIGGSKSSNPLPPTSDPNCGPLEAGTEPEPGLATDANWGDSGSGPIPSPSSRSTDAGPRDGGLRTFSELSELNPAPPPLTMFITGGASSD